MEYPLYEVHGGKKKIIFYIMLSVLAKTSRTLVLAAFQIDICSLVSEIRVVRRNKTYQRKKKRQNTRRGGYLYT